MGPPGGIPCGGGPRNGPEGGPRIPGGGGPENMPGGGPCGL